MILSLFGEKSSGGKGDPKKWRLGRIFYSIYDHLYPSRLGRSTPAGDTTTTSAAPSSTPNRSSYSQTAKIKV